MHASICCTSPLPRTRTYMVYVGVGSYVGFDVGSRVRTHSATVPLGPNMVLGLLWPSDTVHLSSSGAG